MQYKLASTALAAWMWLLPTQAFQPAEISATGILNNGAR